MKFPCVVVFVAYFIEPVYGFCFQYMLQASTTKNIHKNKESIFYAYINLSIRFEKDLVVSVLRHNSALRSTFQNTFYPHLIYFILRNSWSKFSLFFPFFITQFLLPIASASSHTQTHTSTFHTFLFSFSSFVLYVFNVISIWVRSVIYTYQNQNRIITTFQWILRLKSFFSIFFSL